MLNLEQYANHKMAKMLLSAVQNAMACNESPDSSEFAWVKQSAEDNVRNMVVAIQNEWKNNGVDFQPCDYREVYDAIASDVSAFQSLISYEAEMVAVTAKLESIMSDGGNNNSSNDDDSNSVPQSLGAEPNSSMPLDKVIEMATTSWLNKNKVSINDLLDRREVAKIRDELLSDIRATIAMDNQMASKGGKKNTLPDSLPAGAVAMIILSCPEIRLLKYPQTLDSVVIIKRIDANGKFTGIWELCDRKRNGDMNTLDTIAWNLLGVSAKTSTARDVVNAVYAAFMNPTSEDRYVRTAGHSHKLVPCNNGVYNGEDHSFTSWNAPDYEEKYGDITFLYKLDTNYVPSALLPTFFDPDKFIESLFDEDEIGKASVRLIYQWMQFVIRGYSGAEGRTVFFTNDAARADGHNGKSTLMEMVTFIIQHDAVAAWLALGNHSKRFRNGNAVITKSIDTFTDEFALGADIRSAVAIMSDESEGTINKQLAARLKLLARHQPVSYNIKYGDYYSYAFPGVLTHAQNYLPISLSKDGANFTHRLDFGFNKDFRNGDTNIKNRYIVSDEVSEYLLSKVLGMEFVDDYDSKDVAILRANTDKVISENLPTFRFMDDVMERMYWPNLSTGILYELYENWCYDMGEKPLKLNSFNKDVAEWCRKSNGHYSYEAVKHCMDKNSISLLNKVPTGKFEKDGRPIYGAQCAVQDYGYREKVGTPLFITTVTDAMSHKTVSGGMLHEAAITGRQFTARVINNQYDASVVPEYLK